MKSLDHQTSISKPSVSEGWAVHIYDSDRHLRCTLESSHGWVFSAGIGLGILTTIIFSHLNLPVSSKTSADLTSADTAPTATENVRHTPQEFMFWID